MTSRVNQQSLYGYNSVILNEEFELKPAANEVHPIETRNEIKSKIKSRRNEGWGNR